MRRHGLPTLLIVGCARGVDAAAQGWARAHRVQLRVCVADWTRGKVAGHLRNQEMVSHAEPGDWLLAFPSVDSRGTHDCVRRGRRAGLRVVICPPARPSRSATLKPRHGPVMVSYRLGWLRPYDGVGSGSP